MQFRTVKAKTKAGTRTYGQIVRSYRRKSDGMPTHEVIASLGEVTEAQAKVFKAAFSAMRTGAGVQVLDAHAFAGLAPVAQWSRDLLDVAAVLQAWRDCGLHAIVSSLFAGHGDDVDPADVVAALVVQRCVAPASKLAACKWFPKTALPELLGVKPAQFHNSRVHRVLERLDKVDADLQHALSDRMAGADAAPCTALFIDCTDTWFVGNGPPLAELGKTKEEFYRQKVGIALLCRQDGMPLRFKLLRGNTEDGGAMLGMMAELQHQAWLGAVPLVADRALGNTSDLLDMAAMGVRFVTALVASEHAAFGAEFACPALLALDPADKHCIEKAAAAVVAAGMECHGKDLYLLDRPLVQRDAGDRAAVETALGDITRTGYRRGTDMALDMLTVARRYRAAVREGKVPSLTALQRGLGRSNGHMSRIMAMDKLPTDVQEQICQGVARHLGRKAILRVCAGKDPEEHRRVFAQEIANARPKTREDVRTPQPPNDAGQPWVDIAVAFNPLMWREKRRNAEVRHRKVLAKAEELTKRCNRTAAKLAMDDATAQLRLYLKDKKLLKMYALEPIEGAPGELLLTVRRNETVWQRQRARDGIQVLATSPDIDLPAADRVRLYRSKDKIEKDFRDIKSVLELRPVWHRTDGKVRAHVTLCVLALAVERSIEQKLKAAGMPATAAATLEELRSVRLIGQLLPGATEVIAQANLADIQQAKVAEALGVAWALDTVKLGERLRPVR